MRVYLFASVFAAVLLVLLGWQLVNIIRGYKKAQGTPSQRFMAAFSDSLTILIARLTQFGGAVAAFVTAALPVLDPSSTSGQYIASLFNPDTAKYWLAGLTCLGFLFEYVRRRRGSIDPITPPAQVKP